MDILDNARIIKQLTDKDNGWGLWHYISNLNKELEQARHKLNCIRDGRDCDVCDEWCFISSDRLLHIPEESVWDRNTENLKLGDLHKWLIDDSITKEDLQFRLNKIRGIVGSMWSKEDYVQIWCILHGFEPTPDITLGKQWEITKGIIPTKSLSNQLYEVVTQLDKTQSEDEVDKTVMRLNEVLLDWFNEVGFVLYNTYSMLEEAEQILNPQPTQTVTEPRQDKPQQTSNELEYLLGINGIKIAFDMAQEQGYMRAEREYFRWLKENDLLAYFCEKLYNQFLTLTKGNKSWGYFSNVFIAKGTGGKDVIPKGDKINRYKTDWKADRLLYKEDPFCPDGSKDIDLLIATAKRKAEQ